VLTGVCGASDLLLAPAGMRPTFLGRDLGALLEAHPDVRVGPGSSADAVRASCNAAVVTATGSRSDTGAAAGSDGSTETSARTSSGTGTEARGARLEVSAPGTDPLDLLRAGCAAAWAWADRSETGSRPAGQAADALDLTGLLAALTDLDATLTWAR